MIAYLLWQTMLIRHCRGRDQLSPFLVGVDEKQTPGTPGASFESR